MAITETLLSRTRLITRVLQSRSSGHLRFADLAGALGEALDSKVAIVSRKGKVLAASAYARLSTGAMLDNELTHQLNKIDEATSVPGFLVSGQQDGEPFTFVLENVVIVPVYGGGERLGTVLVNRELDDHGLVLAEYASTVVGMEMLYAREEEEQESGRKLAAARMAVQALSYSEAEVVTHVFRDLGGPEGVLVASKIADRVGVTRSVIVNALRKLESAGVITSRSLGMKGTYIKVLNEAFLAELAKLS